MNTSHELRKRNGIVYTPSNLANYVAEKIVSYFFESFSIQKISSSQGNNLEILNLNKIKILDPACGDGELLIATWVSFYETLLKKIQKFREISKIDPKRALCGLDIDERAIRQTKKRIISLSKNNCMSNNSNLIKTNALFPYNRKSRIQGWKVIFNRFQASEGFDILIANPPWGADTIEYQDKLSNGEYTLYKGQFDTSYLFIELALSIVKPGGFFAFIIPDSIFSMERLALRKMLLDETEIKFIGRFGEKIFEKINRACVVLICQKSKAKVTARVDCLRLTPHFRKRILRGEFTFKDAEQFLLHKVPQSQFLNNTDYLFDIDVKEIERKTLNIFKSSHVTFRDYLKSSRGIELSKTGKICKCNHCNMWLPYPISNNPKCTHCKKELVLSDILSTHIINDKPTNGYKPLLVGESINRYLIVSRFWIATNKKGIAYKDKSIYEGPKIVVRKTGVGLLAAIDYQNAFTNQVVYIFKPRFEMNSDFSLELFLAFMNSRAIYYYLVKSHGETEWRSHPYLTQNQILNLPLPKLDLSTGKGLKISGQIVKYLKEYLKNGKSLPPKIDAKVEFLVACLYGLSRKHYERIYDTIEEVEELMPIKPLKKISVTDIFNC